MEPLYGLSFSDPIVYSNKTAADGTSVAVMEDRELEFDDILSAPLPKAPLEVTFRAHWLAIEGVQPLIPENPLPEGMDVASAGKKRKAAEGGDASSGKDPMVQDVLSQELQLYYEKVCALLTSESSGAFVCCSASAQPMSSPDIAQRLCIATGKLHRQIHETCGREQRAGR